MAQLLEALKAHVRKNSTTDEDERTTGVDDGGSEALSKEIFTSYVPNSIRRGLPHPGSIAEATSLSAIQLPATSYPLFDSVSDDIVDNGKLSQLQLESVLYACTKHLTFLPSGQRAGFFIGDGAGVGKGRQVAGLVLDNFARGRRRAVWLSTSSDLHHDAARDLGALGLRLQIVNNCQTLDRETRATGLARDFQEGVLFMTYSTLISNVRGKSRLQQVIDWVGGPDFSGPLVFDECHKAKNFVPGREKQSTKVAAAVLELQDALPRARVVYCSATGVSEVQNMAYMARLGLWGPGSAFPNFEAFLESMKRRGVSFLEMLSMEMKAEGYYVARGLSFKDAEFMELECPLTAEQELLYNDAVSFWKELRGKLVEALADTNTTSKEIWKLFWSAQQRFFKLLCISMKMPGVIEEAQRALAAGHAVVIGLQTTGEAAADALGLEPGRVCGFVSTTRELLQRFVAAHFPTRRTPSAEEVARLGPEPPTEEIASSVVAKSILQQRIEKLQLPPNFLDELVDKLGGPSRVAEMTGRKGRIERDSQGRGVFAMRAKPDSQEMDSLNVKETAAFMRGSKLVAIVSDAASTGISLHASADVPNQRRRVHLTVELPWSADKAIQQLGRSHRSNQTSAPIFKLVLSNLGGERRFAAAVARRLQSLGALTRGDRRAASGIDLSESNLDSPLGRKSLKRMYDCIVLESCSLPAGVALPTVLEGCDEGEIAEVLKHIPDAANITKDDLEATVHRLHVRIKEYLDMMSIGLGNEKRRNDTVAENTTAEQPGSTKDMGDVRRFLNRLLGVEVAKQNLLFNYFVATLASEVKAAKEEGRYSEGVSDLSVANLAAPPAPRAVWTDRHSGLQTLQTDLVTDRGISWEAAARILEHERISPDDSSGFRVSRRPIFGRTAVLLAVQKGVKGVAFDIRRPNTGLSFFDMEADELRQKYQRVDSSVAQAIWEEVYESSKDQCMHGVNCQQGTMCSFGKRLVAVSILSGSIVRVWGVLEAVLQRNEHALNKADRTMRVVRVEFASGDRLIGVRYPAALLPEVVALLSSAQALAPLPAALAHHEQPGRLSGEALQAASLGAGGVMRAEPVSPVLQKSLSKAFRAPKTVLDFFKPKGGASQKPAVHGSKQSANGAGPRAASSSLAQPSARQTAAENSVVSVSDSDSEPGEALQKRRLPASNGGAQPAAEAGEDSRVKRQRAAHGAVPLTDSLGHERASNGAEAAAPSSRLVDSQVTSTENTANGAVNSKRDAAGPGKRSGGRDVSERGAEGDAGNVTKLGETLEREPPSVPTPGPGSALEAGTPLSEGGGRLNRQTPAVLGRAFEAGQPAKPKLAAQPDAAQLDSLVALGFGRDESARALKITGNVERAANWLFQGS